MLGAKEERIIARSEDGAPSSPLTIVRCPFGRPLLESGGGGKIISLMCEDA